MDSLPDTISQMISQLGKGLNSALVWCGAERVVYKSASIKETKVVDGLIDYGVGISFNVNGRRNQGWKMIVTLEPSDTYNVYLWRRPNSLESKKGMCGKILIEEKNIYCDELKSCVERVYDEGIKQFNEGFINI